MRQIISGLLILVGLFLTAAALYLGVGLGWLADRQANEAARLPLATAGTLAESGAGARVLVEGEIAPQDASQPYHTERRDEPQRFVIYDLARLDAQPPGADGTRVIEHVTVARVTPPFDLTTADGELRVVNDDYHYQVDAAYGGWDESAQRLVNGFVLGAPVLVDGRVVQAEGDLVLQASFVHPGPRAAYVDYLRGDPGGRGYAQGIGVLLAAFGVVLLGAGLWWRRR